MEIPPDLDSYIMESIQHTLGLPVSADVLQLKLLALQDSNNRLHDRILRLQDQLKEKDRKINLYMAEAAMNAQAVRIQIEEKEKLRAKYEDLLCKCEKLNEECRLYDRDREALMEFGNEAEERASEAEVRAVKAEENSARTAEELGFYKRECEMLKARETKAREELCLLRQKIEEFDYIRMKDGSEGNGHSCTRCTSMVKENEELRNQLLATTPSTDYQALAAEVESLQNDKEQLRVNLDRAEEEVKFLSEENTLLDEENKMLVRKYNKEKQLQASSGNLSHSTSAKVQGKRKSRSRMSSPGGKVIDLSDSESPRKPLSPLQHNSSEGRMNKK